MTQNSILCTVDPADQMFSRAVLDISRIRVRTFGSDDAGYLVGGRLGGPSMTRGTALVVEVIAPQLSIPRKAKGEI